MSFSDRTRIILGKDMDRLAQAHVCVAGLGGVGAAAAMDLVRSGLGRLSVIDFDRVQESNLNRLYFGYDHTVGQAKTEAFVEFARRVNPDIRIDVYSDLLRGSEMSQVLPDGCDYYLDCIDTLNPKVNLISELLARGLPFSACMGTAGRLAPERLRTGTLWTVNYCPLAAKVRARLRKLGYGEHTPIACVWSDEPAVPPAMPSDGSVPGTVIAGARVRAVQGSTPFVPQAAGHILASLAVRALLGRP